MAKMTRRESRETAFELLFEWSFQGDSLDEVIKNAVEARDVKIDAFARGLAEMVAENCGEIDRLIAQYLQGWKLQRLSKTTLTALRMSLCELTKFDDIPVGASINEAVELVKKFGTEEDAAYLNGILGNFEKVRQGLREAPPVPEQEEATEAIESIEEYEQSVQDEQNKQKMQQLHETQKERGEVELIDAIVIEVE